MTDNQQFKSVILSAVAAVFVGAMALKWEGAAVFFGVVFAMGACSMLNI